MCIHTEIPHSAVILWSRIKILPYSGATVTQKMLLSLWQIGIHYIISPATSYQSKQKINFCLSFPILLIQTWLRWQGQNKETCLHSDVIQEEEEILLFSLPRSIHRNMTWSQVRMKILGTQKGPASHLRIYYRHIIMRLICNTKCTLL